MTYGIGAIGVGVRGQHSYELALARHPDCVLRAVSQYPGVTAPMLEGKNARAHAEEYAQRHGATHHPDHRELLERDDIHIVSLMCEPSVAPNLVEECCASDKHIVRDKPMARDLAGADRIVNAVERSGVKCLVTLNTRFLGSLRALKDRVSGGAIGETVAATFTYLQAGGPLEGFTASPGYFASVGGGELTNFGHYAVDCLRWCIGSEATVVRAHVATRFYPDYLSSGMEDIASATMSFGNGAVGTVVTGRTTTAPKPDSYFRVEITGTGGSLTCYMPDAAVLASVGRTSRVSPGPGPVDSMISAFVEAVKHDAPSPITAQDGREAMRIIDAAYRSARTGTPVSLTEYRDSANTDQLQRKEE